MLKNIIIRLKRTGRKVLRLDKCVDERDPKDENSRHSEDEMTKHPEDDFDNFDPYDDLEMEDDISMMRLDHYLKMG